MLLIVILKKYNLILSFCHFKISGVIFFQKELNKWRRLPFDFCVQQKQLISDPERHDDGRAAARLAAPEEREKEMSPASPTPLAAGLFQNQYKL